MFGPVCVSICLFACSYMYNVHTVNHRTPFIVEPPSPQQRFQWQTSCGKCVNSKVEWSTPGLFESLRMLARRTMRTARHGGGGQSQVPGPTYRQAMTSTSYPTRTFLLLHEPEPEFFSEFQGSGQELYMLLLVQDFQLHYALAGDQGSEHFQRI